MAPSNSRPTIRSLASACGISRTTAALALKNSPRVSGATIAKVKEEAERMGYQVDANLTKLMGYLRNCRSARALCNLGWINGRKSRDHWRTVEWDTGLFTGAQKRAAELGYALDEIWVGEPGFRMERLPKLLRSRGIDGLLFPPHLFEIPQIEKVPWDAVQSILINEPHLRPELHRVDFDATYNVQTALAETIRLGYRRPGLVISRYIDGRNNYALSGQFLTEQGPGLEREKVSPFWMEGWTASTWKEKDFLSWYKRERPDVLFVCNNEWLENLGRMGLRVPQDVGLVHLNLASDVADWAGIDNRLEIAGSAAVDLLVAHLTRGEKGTPPYAKEVQIRGVWRPGKTVAPVSHSEGKGSSPSGRRLSRSKPR